MTNGTIDNENKTPMKEVVAIAFLIIGPTCLLGGASMVWGWGGFLLVLGVMLTALGVTMAFSRTGKG